MTPDITAYVLFAALVGAAIGFFTAAIMASRTIRDHEVSRWREGYAACNRDHARRRPSL